MTKISLQELKKAVQWIEASTNSVMVNVDIYGDAVLLRVVDKNEEYVEISLFDTERSNMFPKITKTERL